MTVRICIGSSCHLKGAPEIVERLQALLKEHNLEADVTLAGSFCFGKCNRDGVTIQVDDQIFTGVTPETFSAFFKEHILKG
jgi:NADH:ubiquinone oxidoreductase subunit E